MKTSYLKVLKYLFLLSLGIFLLLFAFRGQNLNKLLHDLKKANYFWVIVSALFCLIAHIFRALRWGMLIGPLGYGRPKNANMFYAVMIGYLANLAFPRMGEISRCGVINRTNKVPINKLLGTVIIERMIDLLMLVLVILITIALQFKFISHFLYTNILLTLAVRVNTANIILFILIFFAATLGLYYLIIKKDIFGIAEKIKGLWGGLKSGLNSIRYLQYKNIFILYSILIWVLYYLATYLCFFAITATSNLGLIVALSVLVFGSLGMIAPVQGGIGAYHWMVAEGLTIYHIERTDGLSYATIIHSSQVLLILFAGAASLLFIMIDSPKQDRNEKIGLIEA